MTVASSSSGGRLLLLFINTTLDTHLIVAVSPDHTVAALKATVSNEHLVSFPQLGPIVIDAFETSRQGVEFRLSESLVVSDVVKCGQGPCLVRALAAARPNHTREPNGGGIQVDASEVTRTTGVVSGDVAPEKKKRRRLSDGLSSPTIGAVSGKVTPEEKKKRRISKGLSSDFPVEVPPLIKSKHQGEDQNQVIPEEDFIISEKPGDKLRSSPEKKTMKKKKKGKEDTSKIATKEGVIAERGSKLDSSCDYDNSFVCKLLVPPHKKKLLVLDINGLLADIVKPDNLHQHNADFKISGKLGFKRPYCNDFLKFCFENFEVGVWSSRMWYNVNTAVNNLFGGMKKKLLFSWDQSKCTTTTFKTLDNRPLLLKDLNKLWDSVEPGLAWKGQFTPSNTLLIDDSPCKASLNPPYTAIFPYPYKFNGNEDNALGPGGYIRVYLEKIAAAKDIPKFVKKNPFGLATMETHPEWKHYVAIRDALKST